jgi:hypothetical protein
MPTVTIEAGTKFRPRGGMDSPYKNTFRVELTPGTADFSSVQAAIDAAVAAGASPSNLYHIEVGRGRFVGDVEQFEGISVSGSGMDATVIVPQTKPYILHSSDVIVYSFAGNNAIQDLTIEPEDDTLLVALELMVENNSQNRTTLTNVRATLRNDTFNAVEAVRLSGTGGGFVRAMGCYFYSQNHFTGDNSSGTARCVVFRSMPTSKGYLELFGGSHVKTSPGSSNTALSIFAWTQGSGAFSGIHADCDWACIYATAPILHLNETVPLVKGGMMSVRINASDTDAEMQITNPHANARRALMSTAYNNVDVYGALGLPTNPPLPSGAWLGARFATAVATFTPTVGTIYATQIIVERPQVFNALGLRLTTGVPGSTVRVGLYSTDGSGRPLNKLFEGTQDGNVTGEQFATMSAGVGALAPGIYVACHVSEGGAPVMYSTTGNSPYVTASSSALTMGWTATQPVAGSLPAVFPAINAATTVGRIRMRVA